MVQELKFQGQVAMNCISELQLSLLARQPGCNILSPIIQNSIHKSDSDLNNNILKNQEPLHSTLTFFRVIMRQLLKPISKEGVLDHEDAVAVTGSSSSSSITSNRSRLTNTNALNMNNMEGAMRTLDLIPTILETISSSQFLVAIGLQDKDRSLLINELIDSILKLNFQVRFIYY